MTTAIGSDKTTLIQDDLMVAEMMLGRSVTLGLLSHRFVSSILRVHTSAFSRMVTTALGSTDSFAKNAKLFFEREDGSSLLGCPTLARRILVLVMLQSLIHSLTRVI